MSHGCVCLCLCVCVCAGQQLHQGQRLRQRPDWHIPVLRQWPDWHIPVLRQQHMQQLHRLPRHVPRQLQPAVCYLCMDVSLCRRFFWQLSEFQPCQSLMNASCNSPESIKKMNRKRESVGRAVMIDQWDLSEQVRICHFPSSNSLSAIL